MDFENGVEELVNVENFDEVEDSVNVYVPVLYSLILSVLENADGC
jgi:hypothetical protein